MRFFLCCVLFALIAVAYSIPVEVEKSNEAAQSLLDVDVQGHENTGDREARQFGFGYPGGYGGYRGGYGGYRGGYGGGYGGYRGGYGGYRGGYGGFPGGYGGYRGGFYG
ncbi:uncharacterized protein LOC142238469 [Haematobia irritans]|uniref:uncharacterized protein LOC142238469 n=1 Tax=Haematobia irritans TaxID=7368 RepID=UPI003F50A6DB